MVYGILSNENKRLILQRLIVCQILITLRSEEMKHVCDPCGYVYDPAEGDSASGVKPGTAFADLPASWVCPLCGVGKDQFYDVK